MQHETISSGELSGDREDAEEGSSLLSRQRKSRASDPTVRTRLRRRDGSVVDRSPKAMAVPAPLDVEHSQPPVVPSGAKGTKGSRKKSSRKPQAPQRAEEDCQQEPSTSSTYEGVADLWDQTHAAIDSEAEAIFRRVLLRAFAYDYGGAKGRYRLLPIKPEERRKACELLGIDITKIEVVRGDPNAADLPDLDKPRKKRKT